VVCLYNVLLPRYIDLPLLGISFEQRSFMKELISKSVIDELKDSLVQKQQTLAVAESVTSGVLQAVCSAATEAAKFFQGGITTYNLGQKVLHLGIEPIHAEQCNCVSAETAAQMALGVAKMFRSNWGMAVTGYASPVPESNNKLYAFCAISFNGEIVHEERIVPAASDFFPVQLEYALKVIELLKKFAI
jgi:nicotinamide-nucleotide amidase